MANESVSRIATLAFSSIIAVSAVAAISLAGGGDAAAQSRTVRLTGDGLLGREADAHRRVSSAYGYEGTPHEVVPAMLDLAGVGAGDVVYEPGCGDARILIAAMQAGAQRGIGVEIDPSLAEVAYARAQAAGLLDAVEIHWGNALHVDMSEATVVFLFMGEGFNRTIRPLLWQQLPAGARVVSNDYGMGDWVPDRTVRVNTPGRTYTLYRWTITAALRKGG
jgi:hypothetical protein